MNSISGMNTQQLEADIVEILGAYVKPRALAKFVAQVNEAETFEKDVLRESKRNRRSRQDHPSLVKERLDHLITFLQSIVSEQETYNALLEIGNIFKKYGDLQRAEETFTLILGHDGRSKERGYVAEAYMRRGEVYSLQGRWKDSAADLSRSRQIFTKMNEHAAVGRVENMVGTSYAEQGRLREAQKYFHRALTMFEQLRERQMTGTVLMNLGIVHNIMGEYDVALAEYNRAKPYFEAAGDFHRLAELHHNAGMSYSFKSAFEEALREFDVSIDLSTTSKNMHLLGLATLGKAHVIYRKKDFPVALKLIAQAMELFKTSNDRLSIADAYTLRGAIHRELGKLHYADLFLRTGLRVNLELGNRLNIAETYFEIGVLEVRKRRDREARKALEMALQYFKKVGALEEVAKVESMLHMIGGTRK